MYRISLLAHAMLLYTAAVLQSTRYSEVLYYAAPVDRTGNCYRFVFKSTPKRGLVDSCYGKAALGTHISLKGSHPCYPGAP